MRGAGTLLLAALLLAASSGMPAPSVAASQGLATGPVAAPQPAPEQLVPDAPLGGCAPRTDQAGAWRFLSDLPWSAASTGWPAIADVVSPERDVAFSRNPIVLAGQSHEKGLGTYPTSEITYDLGGRYGAFSAVAGINDDAPPGAAAVFLVYADGALISTSGVVRAHDLPTAVDVCVAGVRRLTLVTALPGVTESGNAWPPDPAGAVAVWASARVFAPSTPDVSASGAIRELLDRAAAARLGRTVGELGVYQAYAAETLAAAAQALGVPDAGAFPERTRGERDDTGNVVLANQHLALAIGVGGEAHARLTLVDAATRTTVLYRAASALSFETGALDLTRDTVPAGPDALAFEPVDDPVLGTGMLARLRLRPRETPETAGARVELRVTLFDAGPHITYQVTTGGAWPRSVTGLVYLAAGSPALVTGDAAGAVADASHLRTVSLEGDGLRRHTRLGLGKPAAVWGSALPGRGGGAGSVVFALIDEQRLPAWLVTRRDAGSAAAVAGIAQPLPPPDSATGPAAPNPAATSPGPLAGPRLLVELAPTQDMRGALAHYRDLTARSYPPPPLPPWVRYQWGSWWTYGSAVSEDGIRRQIDTIAERLGDLGPWHIIIDAGWQDVGPGGSGDLSHAASQKFPAGLRALVDYAHSRGVRVLLFHSPVYTHDGNDKGEWLGLPGLVNRQSQWFRRLTPEGASPARYVFDYQHPEARQYLFDVLTRSVTEHGADGVKIDGLGDVEGQLIPFWERVTQHSRRWAITPVMDVYRLVSEAVLSAKPDAFIESGWVNPAPAQSHAHTFRYGDEWSRFSNAYPFPGLAEHFTYAAVQRGVLGQRPNVGAPYGGLERPLSQQWLGAALGLGAHVSLAGDLRVLGPEHLAQLRALLVHYKPFTGTTRTGGEAHGLEPTWAATTVDGLTFLTILNRLDQPKRFTVDLAEAGLAAPTEMHLAYDPTAGHASRVAGVLTADVPPQTLRLLVLRRTAGTVWTTSSYETEAISGGHRLRVRGPSMVDGRLLFYTPGTTPPEMTLDGASLPALTSTSPPDAEGFTYDPATGMLTLGYYHRGEGAFPTRMLEIRR